MTYFIDVSILVNALNKAIAKGSSLGSIDDHLSNARLLR